MTRELRQNSARNDCQTTSTDLVVHERRLPHWRIPGAWYFVTFNIWKGKLSLAEIAFVRQHIIDCSAECNYLQALCVMPDHVHLIIAPCDGVSLSRMMQKIKGTSAILINRSRGMRGRLWQVESWDRIIRDEDELREKLGYMLQNPVKAGLVDDPWMWCGWYLNPDEIRSTG